MSVYKSLTDYLPNIEKDKWGKWIIDKDSKGTLENPIQMPYVSYSDMVRHFTEDVYAFMDEHPEYELNRYNDILEENNIVWEKKSMQEKDISALDGRSIMALIMGAVHSEKFCDGALLTFFNSGTITKWLEQLKEIDSMTMGKES
ncbi:MAG: hypothetical protein GX915_00845 [Clostridiales bacterium]|nr:hypothetical protein [Clostridiales bacterium]